MSDLKMVTLRDEPNWEIPDNDSWNDAFPVYLLEGDNINRTYFPQLSDLFPSYQFLLKEGDEVVATGNTIPLYWDGTLEGVPEGYDEALLRGFQKERTPNTLCGLSVVVKKSYRGKGISQHGLRAMKFIARREGFSSIIIPVRPNRKSDYPLASMEQYVHWKGKEGKYPLDPWLRVHWKAGGRLLKISPHSMICKGSIDEWEEWTGLQFPESGEYYVPRALQPVAINVEQDEGVYLDPNVWVQHEVE